MSRKKLIKLSIFVVIIIAALIIIENSIRGIGTLAEKNRENKKLEEENNIYENSEERKEEILLETVINDLVVLLNNNDINALYALTDSDYKDYKFQNKKEVFEEYIKQYVNNYAKITLQTYEKISGKYVCRLLSEYDGALKSFVTLIEEKEDGSYNIIFDNITGIEKMNKSYVNNNNLKCEILYTVTAQKTLVYTMEYTNLSNKNMDYSYDEIELKDTYRNYFYINTDNIEISLKPGEKMRQDFVFYDGRIHSFPKTSLNIDLKDENGNLSALSIYLETSM